MTKEEIRVLTLAKLRLTARSRILDVGAGTGSLTVECASLARQGWVYAVEKEPAGLELINTNIERFGLSNVTVIPGEAPESLRDLPTLDGVVIGGSGGRLREILQATRQLLKPGARVVLNIVLLQNLQTAITVLEELGFSEVDLLCANIARGRLLGKSRALQPLDPVYIIWGTQPQIEEGR